MGQAQGAEEVRVGGVMPLVTWGDWTGWRTRGPAQRRGAPPQVGGQPDPGGLQESDPECQSKSAIIVITQVSGSSVSF